jgi:hypothetical protein
MKSSIVLLGSVWCVASVLSPLAHADGVNNGDFSQPMSAAESAWRRYFPSNQLPLVPNAGIEARGGVLTMVPAIGMTSIDFCGQVADVGVVQFNITPVDGCIEKAWVELEFDLTMNLAGGYSCGDLDYSALAAEDIPGFKAQVWQQAWDSPSAPYRRLGFDRSVSTVRAGQGAFRYKGAWKQDPLAAYRFAVTIELADVGQGPSYPDPSDPGRTITLRSNQALVSLDHVQLTARSGGAEACTVLLPVISLDALYDSVDSPGVAIAGGGTALSGALVDCVDSVPIDPCAGDLDGSGRIDGLDLGVILSTWGLQGCTSADLNSDGVVSAADLSSVLSAWGDCSGR